MTFERFKKINPDIKILDIHSPEFAKYGEILPSAPFGELIEKTGKTELPADGNIYKASVAELERLDIFNLIEKNFYGGMSAQTGFCNGQNTKINALEYHRGEEINAAATDLALFLGEVKNLKDNTLSTNSLECFFVEKGTVYTMYQTTLHFSPCKVHSSGFRCAVILPKGTNLPLEEKTKDIFPHDKTLFAANKWLIGLEGSKPVSNGAFQGLFGTNYELNSLED